MFLVATEAILERVSTHFKTAVKNTAERVSTMAYMNNIAVCGHMTADLHTQQTQRGDVCYFTLAVNRSKNEVDFIPVRVNSNFISDKLRTMLVKGAAILVSGRIESGSYKNSDGATRSYFYVAPDSIQANVSGNFNVGILFGNLTGDPELRHTPTGVAVASFDIASNRRYKDSNGEWKDATPSFIHVSAWEARGEFVTKYFKKGSGILLAGSIRSRQFEDKNGNKRSAYDFVANTVSFADSGKRDDAGQNAAPASAPAPAASAAPASQPNNGYAAQPQPGTQYDVPDAYTDFEVLSDDEDLPF